MKKLIAVAAAVLVLAGCSAAPSDEGADTARLVPDTAESSEPYETTGPPEPELTDAEVLYLEWTSSETLELLTPGLSDAEVLAAGWASCDQFSQGISWEDIEVVTTDSDNQADYAIAGMASQSLCTDYNVTLVD